MNPVQSAPNGSSLIWVYNICNIGFQSIQAGKRADIESHDLWESG